jgi:predicted amidohydrolase
VLSLQSLPRRLALDFRDVFSEGFAFDFVRGDVTIEQGIAATNNLQMKGVNAAVLMEGKADIARETQDLKVVVVPEINAGTASLVATAINPAIGLGTFLAQMFLREPLMKAATQEFHVDGTWADPRVTRWPRAAAGPRRRRGAANPPRAEGDRMKIAAMQTVSGHAWRPTSSAAAPAAQARAAGRELAVLPEYFCLMGSATRDKLAVRERFGSGAVQPSCAAGARAGLWIVGGTLPLAAATSARAQHQPGLFAAGRMRGALRQDPPVPLRQRPRAVRRVARDRARQRAAVLHAASRDGQPGGSACRSATTCAFPSCTARWRRPAAGAQRLHLRTGQAHWELLLRARAVENLAYVCAPAQGGGTRTAAAPGAIDGGRSLGRGAGAARGRRGRGAGRARRGAAGAGAQRSCRRWSTACCERVPLARAARPRRLSSWRRWSLWGCSACWWWRCWSRWSGWPRATRPARRRATWSATRPTR